MADQFDPYRESLVIETDTEWPAELAPVDRSVQARLEQQLHSQPKDASQIEYVRLHTGFCRKITVTPADLERLK